jgi:hypothetical protein
VRAGSTLRLPSGAARRSNHWGGLNPPPPPRSPLAPDLHPSGTPPPASHPSPPPARPPIQQPRDRQKALIASLEEEVAAKISQMGLLANENEALRLRGSVLEMAVKGREIQVGGG